MSVKSVPVYCGLYTVIVLPSEYHSDNRMCSKCRNYSLTQKLAIQCYGLLVFCMFAQCATCIDSLVNSAHYVSETANL